MTQEFKLNEYCLQNFKNENDGTGTGQVVIFYEKNDDGTETNGTTLEEMLRVTIARLQTLNSKFPCRENSIVLTKLQESLMWLNARTADRVARGVEGQHVA